MPLLPCLALALAAMTAESLTTTERAISRAVDARTAAAIDLLERLVNINSDTMNFAGVRAVGDILRHRLDALGFRTRWVDGAPFGRAGYLVAEHTGSGPRLLLVGHLDTVFEPSSPFQKVERLADSTARGPGIIDMKGGDVIMVLAMEALRDAGVLSSLHITIVMNGDEEHAGEPIAEARRARILDRFRTRLAGEPYLTFNPGVAPGGARVALDTMANKGTAEGKTNIVAERMTMQGDLRALSPEQLQRT